MPFPALLAAALPYLGAAGLGALGSKLGSKEGRGSVGQFFGGTPGQEMRFERFTPEQQQALSQILQQSLGALGGPGGFGTGGIEQQARTGFAQQTVPTIAERFTGLGAGAQRSSAFAQTLGQAGAGLEEGLAAQKQGLLQNLLGLGLSPQFESAYRPSQPGFAQTGVQGLMAALPYLAKLGGQ